MGARSKPARRHEAPGHSPPGAAAPALSTSVGPFDFRAMALDVQRRQKRISSLVMLGVVRGYDAGLLARDIATRLCEPVSPRLRAEILAATRDIAARDLSLSDMTSEWLRAHGETELARDPDRPDDQEAE